MQQPGISFGASGKTYSVPTTFNAGYTTTNYNTTGAQIQPINVNTTSQVITGQPTYVNSYQTVGNVQRIENYASEQGYEVKPGQQGGYGNNVTIGQYGGNLQQLNGASYQPVIGGNYQLGSGNAYAATGATGGGSFTVKPQAVNFGGSRAQTITAAQPVSYMQAVNQPTTTTYIQPSTTQYYQQPLPTQYIQPTSYIQPAVTTTYTQPVQEVTASYVAIQPANQWVQEEFERPKYPKLYNNSAEYYRNLAPEEDPTIKKSCCSPCCWVLWGLLGLLGMLFGILCGLGILCGGGFSLGLPSLNASLPNVPKPDINVPNIGVNTPNITVPDINLPNINIPTPNINVPNIGVNTPNVTVPDANINIPTPNINIPTPNINIPTPNINVPVAPVAPTTSDDDFAIDPMAVDMVPVVNTTPTTNTWTAPANTWSSTNSWSSGTSGAAVNSAWSGNSAASTGTTSDVAFIEPTFASTVPVSTAVSSGSATGVTSPSSLGLRSSTSGSDSGSVARTRPLLGEDPITWEPAYLGYQSSSNSIDTFEPVN